MRPSTAPVSTAMLATGTNPSLTLGKAPSNPPPVPSYKDKWVKRTYQSFKSAANATGTASFLNSSFGVPGDKYFVDKIQVWRLGFDNVAEPGLVATFNQGFFTDLGVDAVTAMDFGTGSALPGVTCKVPLGHAVGVSTAGTNSILDVTPAVASGTQSATANYVAHLTCWVSI